MSVEERIEYLVGPLVRQKFEAKDQDWMQFQREHRGSGDPKYEGWPAPHEQWTTLLGIDGQILADNPLNRRSHEKGYLPPFIKMLRRISSSDIPNNAPQCAANEQKQALLRMSDPWDPERTFPFFTKTRGVGGGGIVLQSIKKFRHWIHWGPCSKEYAEISDPKWNDKTNRAVWRGASTGGINVDEQVCFAPLFCLKKFSVNL